MMLEKIVEGLIPILVTILAILMTGVFASLFIYMMSVFWKAML